MEHFDIHAVIRSVDLVLLHDCCLEDNRMWYCVTQSSCSNMLPDVCIWYSLLRRDWIDFTFQSNLIIDERGSIQSDRIRRGISDIKDDVER